jgi:signal transduction histidine kinase
MITNLLDISKGDEGQPAPVMRMVDTVQLVDGVLEELHLHAASARVAIDKHITASTMRSSCASPMRARAFL